MQVSFPGTLPVNAFQSGWLGDYSKTDSSTTGMVSSPFHPSTLTVCSLFDIKTTTAATLALI